MAAFGRAGVHAIRGRTAAPHSVARRNAAGSALRLRLGAIDGLAAVSEFNRAGTITRVSPQYCALSGYSRAQAIGRQHDFMHVSPDADYTVCRDAPWQDEARIARADGSLLWLRRCITPLGRPGARAQAYLCIDFDISAERQAADAIRVEQRCAAETAYRVARIDHLTGMPNRAAFFEMADEAIAVARRRGTGMALLHLDLDRFSQINHCFGHAAGDHVLVEAGRRMHDCMRGGDRVVRIGGDEFVALVANVTHESSAAAVAERLIASLEPAFAFDGHQAFVSASAGIAVQAGDPGLDAHAWLRQAGMALALAKKAPSRYAFFRPGIEQRNRQRLELEHDLRHALERGELTLEYQPKFHPGFSRVVGAEALLRWQHPRLGRIPPDRFIPVAEASGLICTIGKWVIEEVCRQIKRWENQGLAPVQVAINLSPPQCRSGSLFEDITDILARAEILPGQIEFEVTESLLMDAPDAALALLKRLRAAGFSITIDDFGTGYSSLAYLRKLPVAVLKIDRIFVKDLTTNLDHRAIAAAVLAMADSLLLDVVAEGVETRAQLELLRGMGCDYVQGGYISKALPADQFAKFMKPVEEVLTEESVFLPEHLIL